MSNLRENFDTLIEFAGKNNFSESFSQVYFVEEKSMEFVLKSRIHKIPRESIFTFESYKTRFDALFDEGHSWINMYLAGIVENALLVIIEVPHYADKIPREFVSVKFSLPEKRILENDWKIEPFYEIID